MMIRIVTSPPKTFRYEQGTGSHRPDGLYRAVSCFAKSLEKNGCDVRTYILTDRSTVVEEEWLVRYLDEIRTPHLAGRKGIEEVLSEPIDCLILSLGIKDTAAILSLLAENKTLAHGIAQVFVMAGPKAKRLLIKDFGMVATKVVYLDKPGVARITRKATLTIMDSLNI